MIGLGLGWLLRESLCPLGRSQGEEEAIILHSDKMMGRGQAVLSFMTLGRLARGTGGGNRNETNKKVSLFLQKRHNTLTQGACFDV